MNLRLERKNPLVDGDKKFHCFTDFRLSESDLNLATRELNETEERKRECLRKLKVLLSSKKFLPLIARYFHVCSILI